MAGLLNHGTIDTLGWDNSLLWGTALYILGSWVFSSLPGLHLLEACRLKLQQPKNASRHCQKSSGGKGPK